MLPHQAVRPHLEMCEQSVTPGGDAGVAGVLYVHVQKIRQRAACRRRAPTLEWARVGERATPMCWPRGAPPARPPPPPPLPSSPFPLPPARGPGSASPLFCVPKLFRNMTRPAAASTAVLHGGDSAHSPGHAALSQCAVPRLGGSPHCELPLRIVHTVSRAARSALLAAQCMPPKHACWRRSACHRSMPAGGAVHAAEACLHRRPCMGCTDQLPAHHSRFACGCVSSGGAARRAAGGWRRHSLRCLHVARPQERFALPHADAHHHAVAVVGVLHRLAAHLKPPWAIPACARPGMAAAVSGGHRRRRQAPPASAHL